MLFQEPNARLLLLWNAFGLYHPDIFQALANNLPGKGLTFVQKFDRLLRTTRLRMTNEYGQHPQHCPLGEDGPHQHAIEKLVDVLGDWPAVPIHGRPCLRQMGHPLRQPVIAAASFHSHRQRSPLPMSRYQTEQG